MSYKCTNCGHKQDNSDKCVLCGNSTREVDHTGAWIGAGIGFMEDGVEGAIIGGLLGSLFDDD